MPTPEPSPLAKVVCAILRGSSAYCTFIYGGLTFTQRRLLDVADYIERGAIQVEEMSMFSSGESAAEYYPHTEHPDGKSTMRVRKGLRQSDHVPASNAFHEAVHASQDIQMLTLAQEDAEAMAFLAQAVYFRYHRFHEPPKSGNTSADAIMKEAFAIASANVGGFAVSASDQEKLKKVILANPHYNSVIDPVYKYRFPGVPEPKLVE